MSTPEKPAEPRTLQALLRHLAGDQQWRRKLAQHRIFESWPAAVGPEIAAHAYPWIIRASTLWVKVTDPIWMQQLHLQKILLLQRINRELTDARLDDIRFQLDPTYRPPPPPPAEPQLLPPDPDELREFDKLLATLPDERTRQALRSFWITLHRRQVPAENQAAD